MAEAMIKAAAVGGVAAMWSYFTLKTARLWTYFTHETLKICDKIVFPPEKPPVYRCEYCSHSFTSDFLSQREGHNCYFYVCRHCEEKEDVCVRCGERFIDVKELDVRFGDEKNDKPLCEFCVLKK